MLSRVSDEALQEVLDTLPDAILLVDRDGRVPRANGQALKLFGYASEELPEISVEAMMPERFRAVHVEHRGVYVTAPRMRSMGSGLELFARRKDESEFPVDISLSPVETSHGPMVVVAVRDITERVRLMKALNEQVALRQRFEQALRRSQTAHINRALFRTLGRAASVVLYPAGLEAGSGTFDFVRETWMPKNDAELIRAVEEYFRTAGLCSRCDIALDRPAHRLRAHVEDAFEAAEHVGGAEHGVCHFLRGLLASLGGELLDISGLVCEENACKATGSPACEFVVLPMLTGSQG